jgi:hypothetical protein
MPPLLNLFGLMFLFLVNNFLIVFLVLKEILRLEFLNNYVMNLVCFPTYINFTDLGCAVSVVYAFSFLVWLTLFKIAVSHLLLCSICFIVLFSFYFSILFMGYVDNRLVKYLTAATLCSGCGMNHLG